jgi:hypothetical protein
VVKTVEDAYEDFWADRITDPMRRYSSSEREIFAAGWKAATKKRAPIRESVWFSAPVAPEDDPE